MEDSGWAVSGTALLPLSLGSLWLCLKEFEHVFTTTVVIALHKGRISHTFRASAHTTETTHSPEVLSSISSKGLRLEHGRVAQRSLSSQKKCHVSCSRSQRFYHPRYQRCRAHGTTSRSMTTQSHEAIPHTSPTPRKGTHSPLPLPHPLLTEPSPRHQPPA